ncbi:MAG TPA: sulfur oxidation c-type cytochrome SoxX [Usitatibacter sp.]|nr:sulfur oxidation c-type cytochrome SoxX [Usitatibacter sp.]
MSANGAFVLALLFSMAIPACAVATRGDAIEKPFAASGDPTRGRALFVARDGGHCVLCHAAPGIAPAGNVGPPLAGVGSRLTEGEIRLRIADITRVNPDAAMPTFHRVAGMKRVAVQYRGKPVLDGRQVEDLVAYLASLR